MGYKITRNWQREVNLGYVCSDCAAVVNLKCWLSMHADASSILFYNPDNDVKIACDYVLKRALNDISECSETLMRMGGKHEVADPENENICNVNMNYQFTFIESQCPFCGHVEEWQKSGGEWEASPEDGLEKWNFPILFDTEENCRNGLAETVHSIKTERMAYWKNNPQKRAGIIEQEELLKVASKKVKEKIEDIQLSEAEAQKEFDKKKNEANELPLFSAEKKMQKELLKVAEKSLTEQKERYKQELEKLQSEQKMYLRGLHRLKCQKLGFTGEIKEYRGVNSAAYRTE